MAANRQSKPDQNGITQGKNRIKTAINFAGNRIAFTRVAEALKGEPILPPPALFGIGEERGRKRLEYLERAIKAVGYPHRASLASF